MAWTLGSVRASGEAYLRELGRAHVARLAGRPAPAPQEIRRAYDHDLGRGAIDVALELAETAAPDEAEARSGRALLAWLTRLEVERACEPVDEWIAEWWERATIRTPDARVVPMRSVDREIAREADRSMRLQLDAARVALLERDLVPTLAERMARERDTIERVGIGGSLREVAERLSGEDPAALAGPAREALVRSVDTWQDSLNDRMRRELSVSRTEARPADLSAALDASLFDGAFRASGRQALTRRILTEMGFDPELNGRLRIDMMTRARGASSECIAVEVRGAIHLAFGEDPGVDGHRHALEALGVGLRLAHVERDAPFEHRWTGDPSVSMMFGTTLASVLVDEPWLMRYADLSRSEARRLARLTALAALHDLRRTCALHIHCVESLDAGLPLGAYQELYAETVGSAVGVRPHLVDAMLDAPHLTAPGARLRGMQGASELGTELVERFDVDWYRNPRTGPWLQTILEPARGETAADVIKSATGRGLSLEGALVRLERTLAA